MDTAKNTKAIVLGCALALGCASAVPAWGAADRPTGLGYVNQAHGPAIFGYPGLEGVERPSAESVIVYANPAYGQAIYSYPQVGGETVAGFNVEYADPAYGQAIHGYPHWGGDALGEVEILPVAPD